MKESLIPVLTFLKKSRLLSFATISGNGFPQISYLYYIYNEGNIFIATTEDSRKVKNIKKINKVGMMIGTEVEPQILQLEGQAHLVTETEERLDTLLRIATVANQNPNSLNMPPLVSLLKRSDLGIIKVTIDTFKFSDFSLTNAIVIEGTGRDLA
ncbi:MAG: pyridoxamine 5'-phosphate oxidase family protein [bacterium]|nr:pyridoxamine 5'-phosphate oxidase family protein [bacterium]